TPRLGRLIHLHPISKGVFHQNLMLFLFGGAAKLRANTPRQSLISWLLPLEGGAGRIERGIEMFAVLMPLDVEAHHVVALGQEALRPATKPAEKIDSERCLTSGTGAMRAQRASPIHLGTTCPFNFRLCVLANGQGFLSRAPV